MIDLEFVQQLIRTVDESSIDNVEIERGGTRIRVSKTPSGISVAHAPGSAATQAASGELAARTNSPPPAEPAPSAEGAASPEEEEEADDGWIEITSPMVGTFYRAPSPGTDPFTEVGKRIAPGDTLCIIEAMKLMNELESEIEGTVRSIQVENGEPVEYGQVLFRVEPV